jgi:hypothetical protein
MNLSNTWINNHKESGNAHFMGVSDLGNRPVPVYLWASQERVRGLSYPCCPIKNTMGRKGASILPGFRCHRYSLRSIVGLGLYPDEIENAEKNKNFGGFSEAKAMGIMNASAKKC